MEKKICMQDLNQLHGCEILSQDIENCNIEVRCCAPGSTILAWVRPNSVGGFKVETSGEAPEYRYCRVCKNPNNNTCSAKRVAESLGWAYRNVVVAREMEAEEERRFQREEEERDDRVEFVEAADELEAQGEEIDPLLRESIRGAGVWCFAWPRSKVREIRTILETAMERGQIRGMATCHGCGTTFEMNDPSEYPDSWRDDFFIVAVWATVQEEDLVLGDLRLKVGGAANFQRRPMACVRGDRFEPGIGWDWRRTLHEPDRDGWVRRTVFVGKDLAKEPPVYASTVLETEETDGWEVRWDWGYDEMYPEENERIKGW